MAIPAIRSGGFGSSLFQRANREAQRIGGQVTHAKMQEVASVIGGSNFGSSCSERNAERIPCRTAVHGEYGSEASWVEQVPADEPRGTADWWAGDARAYAAGQAGLCNQPSGAESRKERRHRSVMHKNRASNSLTERFDALSLCALLVRNAL